MGEFRFHHLERRRVDQALPGLLERLYEEGTRALVRAPSDEMVAALNDRLWTYDDASFLPHGAAGDGDPMTQPIFLTAQDREPERRDRARPARRGRDEPGRRRVRSRHPPVRRPRPGCARRGAPRVEAPQGRGADGQLLARGRGRRLGAGALSRHKVLRARNRDISRGYGGFSGRPQFLADAGRSAFGFSWPNRTGPRGKRFTGVSHIWFSLVFLVRNKSFQWVTRLERHQIFSRLPGPGEGAATAAGPRSSAAETRHG